MSCDISLPPDIEYLEIFLEKVHAPGILDERVDNGITDYYIAVSVLHSAGVINDPDYWRGVDDKDTRALIIKKANNARIVLEKIIHAEASGENFEGMVLVGNVIMNRHKSPNFPDGIYNVVFEQGQFTPTSNGAYDKAVPSESVKKAVTAVLNGMDDSRGALYFCTLAESKRPNNYHERARTFLFEVGTHRFYR